MYVLDEQVNTAPCATLVIDIKGGSGRGARAPRLRKKGEGREERGGGGVLIWIN